MPCQRMYLPVLAVVVLLCYLKYLIKKRKYLFYDCIVCVFFPI